MATYATIADARGVYGQDYVTVSVDRDGDSLADEAAFGNVLDAASARIDKYAAPYFPDGLPATAAAAPGWWKMCCIDIAIYFASAEAGPRTEEKRKRYEDAIDMLTDEYPKPETTAITAPSSTMDAVVSAEDRVFTRTKMGELL